MGGLIFFAVIIAWFSFSIWFARKIVRWLPVNSPIAKFVVGVLAFGVILMSPLTDEIIGKIQFDKLCREEAGVKIYGKLELGPEFFNADGTPNFIDRSKWFGIDERMERLVEFGEYPNQDIESLVGIWKRAIFVKDRTTGKPLAVRTGFTNGGGWLSYAHHPWLNPGQCHPKEGHLEMLKQIITNVNSGKNK